MAKRDDLMATIEAIHAAGLDDTQWSRALAEVARVVVGNAASIEVCDSRRLRHLEMYSCGMPGAEDVAFREDFAEINVRFPSVARQKRGQLLWDYMILDETAMNRAPFYTEVLPRFDMRYFVAAVVMKSSSEFAAVAVHRSARAGHVQRDGIAAMRVLAPHFGQAFDVARRLRVAERARDCVERALDWLADGVALVDASGVVLYVNESLQAILRRGDGVRLCKGTIEFAEAEVRDKFAAAIAAAVRLKRGEPDAQLARDFVAPPSTARDPYIVSIRPLLDQPLADRQTRAAAAVVFVRDPLSRAGAAIDALRELFGFTEAEASLAQALQAGVAAPDYARARGLSLNTVHTHLRRLREKTGCSRLPELIHKLNELRMPLREQ
jgi:DNA-binding CsgD family transcriptional regulator/PAS domain-containing protein